MLAAAGLNLRPDESVRARIEAFLEARARWSRTHNLSGPRALDDPWATDVLDGMAVVDCLAMGIALIDVGAGSGVPGLLVACAAPEARVQLIEPRAKRAAFLRSVAAQLGLHHIAVTRARWPFPIAEAAQVVSRAVVSPDEWPGLAVSGGAAHSVLRMLAAHRPPMDAAGYALARAVDYCVPNAGARRVERWDRTERPEPVRSGGPQLGACSA